MKLRTLLLAALLLTGISAFGQIALVGGCAAVATSCTPVVIGGGVFATGQFEYTFAFKSSVTAPTLATNYTSVATISSNSSSYRSGCAVMTSATPFTNAWTGATAVVTLIYSGEAATTTANCVTTGVGGNASQTGTTSTYTYQTVTMTHANASSWVIGAMGSTAATCTPATVLHSQESSTNIIGNDTNGVVSSFSTLTCTGTTGNWHSNTVELLAAAVATPTFGTNGGTFGTSASTTLSDATGGATICYSTDNSIPASTTSGTCSAGSTYSSSFGVSPSGAIVNALGTEAGLSNSALATSSIFTINPFLQNLSMTGVSGGDSVPQFVVGTAQGLNTNGGTTTGIDTTGVNLLTACVAHLGTIATTLSDNCSNSFTLIRSEYPGSQMQNDFYYDYAPNTCTSHTFTLAGTGSRSGISVLGFRNVAPNPIDQQNGVSDASNHTSYGPGTIVPATNNEVVVPCLSMDLGSIISITGLQGLQQYIYSASNYSEASSYSIQTAAASINPSYTWTSTAAAAAANEVSFLSNQSALLDCSACAYLSSASTSSGAVSAATDPTSYTASTATGTLLIALGWHTNWSGSGTTSAIITASTTPNGIGTQWHSCADGSTNAFTDVHSTSTGGMSCNYIFTTLSQTPGATIVATDCVSNCTGLGGIFLAFSGVFVPRAWDAFSSNPLATSTSGSNNMNAGTITTKKANALIVVYCSKASTAAAATGVGTSPISFTLNQNLQGSGEHAIWSSSGAVTPTMTGASSAAYGCLAVAFD